MKKCPFPIYSAGPTYCFCGQSIFMQNKTFIQIQGVEMVGLGVEMGGFSDQGVETGRFRYLW